MDAQIAVDDQGIAAGGGLSPRGMVALLTLEPVEADTFRARGVLGETGRLYGGQVAAQALAAAGHTVTWARPHSLHAYFLRPGNSARPVLFKVDRLHDGRTFHRRRVTAIQRGEPILCLESSFVADASPTAGCELAPSAPAPEDCPRLTPDVQAAGRLSPWNLLEARPVPYDGPLARASAADLWLRFRAGQGISGVTPEVLLTYLSDLTLASATLRPTGQEPAGRPDVTSVTSLDHSVWFHNTVDLSGWLLYAKSAAAAGRVRGLAAGRVYDEGGVLVASVVQEALLHAGGGVG